MSAVSEKKEPWMSICPSRHSVVVDVETPAESLYTSRTLKFTLLTLFQHDTCGLQRIGLTRPFFAWQVQHGQISTPQVWKSDCN